MMKEFKTNSRSITDRGDICVSNYLRDVNRYETISAEEEAELSRLIKKGGKEGEKAKERLINANLRFVISVANQYKMKGMELADIISEGNIGLVKAAQNFDDTRGFKFISYAVWWIRQSIISAIGNYSTTLRLPSNQQRLLQEYHRMNREMMQIEQRNITIEEFCEATGLSTQIAQSMILADISPVKMDSPLDSDSDNTIGDMLPSELRADSDSDRESLQIELSSLLGKCLKEREVDIVCRYLGFGCEATPLDAIAESWGLSRERTRQIYLKAITKLRQSPLAHSLFPYLAA